MEMTRYVLSCLILFLSALLPLGKFMPAHQLRGVNILGVQKPILPLGKDFLLQEFSPNLANSCKSKLENVCYHNKMLASELASVFAGGDLSKTTP